MKITAFDGSPRGNSNSYLILKRFIDRAGELGGNIEYYKTDELELKQCRGCLMCNVLKRCAIKKDCWAQLAERILESDALVFSTPVYFHHTTSSMKKLIDRFRSFIKVQITEDGIIHQPHREWNKRFFLFTAHGSSAEDDALPLRELFMFMNEVLGEKNSLDWITAVRLAFPGQIAFDRSELGTAYKKLGLPERLIDRDLEKNRMYLKTAEGFAESLFE